MRLGLPPRGQRPAPPPAIQSLPFAAPSGGLNAVSPIAEMPASDCVQAYNLVASEYGLRSRLGYREWCTGLTGATDNQVRSILPFTGSAQSGANNKLFATTSTGIWGVSASSSTPSQVLAFASSAGDAGYGVATVVVTAAGHFLVYADEVNGLHVYTESTNTWAAVAMGGGAAQISGVDPADIAFATMWKGRQWLVEKDSTRAWYSASGAVYGAHTSFNFAQRFKAGGTLIGLWSWTYDGGSGIDDALVAISSGGDVCIYIGTDPAAANTFSLKGVWNVGAIPAGRAIASDFGGDLLILTKSGILPLSRLVTGAALSPETYATQKIAPLFNSAMLSRSSYKRWSIRQHPEDQTLVVTVPEADGTATTQLAMALSNRSWYRYRDLPIYSSEVWGGKLYFGTTDGKVCINDGYLDGVTLADPNVYTPVQWALLTAFTNLGNGRAKQIQAFRPRLLSEGGAPSYSIAARYDFDFTELATVSTGVAGGNVWDSALWDSGTWAGEYQPSSAVVGATGLGTFLSLAIRGTANSRTVFAGVDVMFTQGGLI